jgi:Family of unknown function (DUF6232)
MEELVLFQSGTIQITPSIARFDNVSYQIANLGSVSMTARRAVNRLAIALIIASALGLFTAFEIRQGEYGEYLGYALLISAALFVCGMVVQNFWPAMTYKILLNTSSGNVQVLASHDRNCAEQVKDTIEYAFRLHHHRTANPPHAVES